MEFRKVLALRGPNRWGPSPALEVWLDPGSALPANSADQARLADRLRSLVPSGRDLGERIRRGMPPAELLGAVATELQLHTGSRLPDVPPRLDAAGEILRVIVPFDEETVARESLELARRFCMAALADEPFDAAAELARLQERARRLRLAPTLEAIAEAARARGIPAWRVDEGKLLLLGYGARQRRVVAEGTDRTAIIGHEIAETPELCRSLLRDVGIPVPIEFQVSDVQDAWDAARRISPPVLVRPRGRDAGKGVSPGLMTRSQVAEAFERAVAEGADEVMVERQVAGDRYRLLVVGGRMVAAVRLTGGAGGPAEDVSERVHAEVAARAAEAASVVGFDAARVELAAIDIGVPLEEQAGAVTGIASGLDLGIAPEAFGGSLRPIGAAIVESLFPEGRESRVPVVGVTGVNGKTTTVRLIAHLLRHSGSRVGMTCTDGVFLDDRQIAAGDCSGPASARAVLLNPRVEAAVLETARGGILRAGLGFDRCDVAVVTNIGEGDHLGQGGVESLEELARVKRVLVENVAPDGFAVLKADDPLVAAMAVHCPGLVIYFARDPDAPVLKTHRQAGGRAVFVRDDTLVVAEGAREEVLGSVVDLPLTFGGRVAFQVENALAAAAAAWALGLDLGVIRAGLASFSGDAQQAPGRFNVLEFRGQTTIVDYGHNTSAMSALVEALDHFPQPRRTISFTAAGDRRDQDIVDQGTIIGNGFDRVILYEDKSTRGRPRGQIIGLFRRGLASGTRVAEIHEAYSEPEAIALAFRSTGRDDLIVLQADDSVETTLEYVRRYHDRETV